jgi:hypothetical protein
MGHRSGGKKLLARLAWLMEQERPFAAVSASHLDKSDNSCPDMKISIFRENI